MMEGIPSVEERTAYIIEAARARGIDPEVAIRVAQSEGLRDGVWQSTVPRQGEGSHNDFENSWGDFQLYKGGGLGNDMIARTGLDPADPKNWKAGIDFALDHAKEKGWGAWYGAKRVGITGMAGIDGAARRPPSPAGNPLASVPSPSPAGNPLSTGTPPTQGESASAPNALQAAGEKLSGLAGAGAASPLSLAMYGQRRPQFSFT